MSQDLFGAPACLFELGKFAFGPGQGISDVNPATVWQNSYQAPGNFSIDDQYSSATSTQSSVTNERSGGVSQQLGQIIPPNDVASESFTSKRTSPPRASQEEDILKRNRSQRARDAANKRHSKSKNAKMGSGEGGGGGAEDGKEAKGPKFEQYRREKNRVATAKCRAKKKNHAQDLSTKYRQESTTNVSLKHQERELRNMLTFLRSCSLQHNSSHCDCKFLHQYNIRQAQNIARVVESPGSLSTYSSSQESAPLVNFHVPQRLQRG